MTRIRWSAFLGVALGVVVLAALSCSVTSCGGSSGAGGSASPGPSAGVTGPSGTGGPQGGSGAAGDRVVDVPDGDSLRVEHEGSVESVRLIGIDAPEEGEPYYEEAQRSLADLVSGGRVRLEADVEERDQYGRLLAYGWVGDAMVNAEQLRRGVVTLYTVPPNVTHEDELRKAQDDAQQAGRGVWAGGDSPLEITQIHYDAAGDDAKNLNDEYVDFNVLRSGSLAGYAVEDQSGQHYDFRDITLPKGQTFRLRSGRGTDTPADLYWGRTGGGVWDNSGDMVKVLDPRGRVVASQSYEGH